MKKRIVGLETEYALLHYPDDGSTRKPLTGTELFERMNGLMDDAGVVRLYEEKFYPEARSEPFSSIEDRRRYSMKKNRMFLSNGARYYLDTGDHPEYATPECRSAIDLVIHDKAGEQLVSDLFRMTEAKLAEEGTPGRVVVCKYNIDVRGNTFGCHENYMVLRNVRRQTESSFFKQTIRELIPFLVTRQIFCGSGKVFTGNKMGFQVSQRADFIDSELSSDTTFRRGIINSRDEPLANIERYRRLHILVGDSNLSEMATYLKVGTTMLLLRLIEEKGVKEGFALEDPILALREISHDPTCKIKLKMADGSYLSPIEIQRLYLQWVRSYLEDQGDLQEPETAAVLKHWERVLQGLDGDPLSLKGDVDWIAKLWITDRYLERSKMSYRELNKWVYFIKRIKGLRLEESLYNHFKRNPNFKLQPYLESRLSQGDFIELKRHVRYSDISMDDYFRARRVFHYLLELDILFHDINPNRGLFYKMRRKNLLPRFDHPGYEKAVERARTEPPRNTRAKIRGEFVKLISQVPLKGAATWDSLTVHDVKLKKIFLSNPFNSTTKSARELFEEMQSLARLGGSR